MSKRERIAELERKVAALEREVASIPRWHWISPNAPYTYPPLKVGDGTADVQPIVSPTITWTTGSNSSSGVTQ